MIVTCEDCKLSYDDARMLTYCPHDAFLSEFDAAMKDGAMQLIGRPIMFADGRPDKTVYRVQSIGWRGQITLVGKDEEFEPFLFVIARETAR